MVAFLPHHYKDLLMGEREREKEKEHQVLRASSWAAVLLLLKLST